VIRRIFRKACGLPAILFIITAAFQSCIFDDMDCCSSVDFEVVIKDVYGTVLTESTVDSLTVYLFTRNGFRRMVQKDFTNTTFHIGYEKGDSLTLVSWGNLKSDSLTLPQVSYGMSPEEAVLKLRKEGGCNVSPPDLFYSRYSDSDSTGESATDTLSESGIASRTVTATSSSKTLILYMSRATSLMSITVRNMKDYFSLSDTTGYGITVEGSHDAVDFSGVSSGDSSLYRPVCCWTDSDAFYTPAFRILPVTEDDADDCFTVSLYRDATRLFTTNTDEDGQLIRVAAGKQINITIDFGKSDIRVYVTITPWNNTGQDTEL
jgi:hypothetical protein